MEKVLDTINAYTGLHGRASKCRLRVYEAPDKPTVVIVTELPDNCGTSVTNFAEQLATEVWKMLERPAQGIIWCEHYPPRGKVKGRTRFGEEFDLVSFIQTPEGFCDPDWRSISKAEVEALIGQTIQD